MSLKVVNGESLPLAININSKLSFREKGVLAYLTFLGDRDSISIDFLTGQSSDGRSAIRTAISGLEKNGFLQRTRVRNSRGNYDSADWLVDCSGQLLSGE